MAAGSDSAPSRVTTKSPNAMVAGEDLPGRPHGSNENLPIQGGDPARRGIKDTFGGSF